MAVTIRPNQRNTTGHPGKLAEEKFQLFTVLADVAASLGQGNVFGQDLQYAGVQAATSARGFFLKACMDLRRNVLNRQVHGSVMEPSCAFRNRRAVSAAFANSASNSHDRNIDLNASTFSMNAPSAASIGPAFVAKMSRQIS